MAIVRWHHRDSRYAIGDWICPGRDTRPGSAETTGRVILAFARRGVYRRRLGRRTRVVDPGTVAFYPAEAEFHVTHPEPGLDRSLLVAPTRRGLECLGRRLPEEPAFLSHAGALLLRRVDRAAREGAALLVEELVPRLVAEATGGVARSRAARPGTRAARRAAVERAREVIALRYAERLTLDVIAREAACSRDHLSEVFREATGFTLHGYLTRVRLLVALEALNAPASLTRIAYDAGFATPSHFAAVFRRAFGQPPSRVRARIGPREETQVDGERRSTGRRNTASRLAFGHTGTAAAPPRPWEDSTVDRLTPFVVRCSLLRRWKSIAASARVRWYSSASDCAGHQPWGCG